MFVPRIEYLTKTRFGVNFKAEDIKCNIKNNKKLPEKIDKKLNKFK